MFCWFTTPKNGRIFIMLKLNINKLDYRYERKFFVTELSNHEVESIVRLHPAMFSAIFKARVVFPCDGRSKWTHRRNRRGGQVHRGCSSSPGFLSRLSHSLALTRIRVCSLIHSRSKLSADSICFNPELYSSKSVLVLAQ